MTLLTIAIPTTEDRKLQFDRLEFELWKQIERDGLNGVVNVISICDNKEMTIGEKRNMLYNHPESGVYQGQWDDDDWIHAYGLKKIIDDLSIANVDCMTYQELCIINGEMKRSNHSLVYPGWADNYDGWDYVRTPYMKDVIRTEIARKVTVPHIRFGEDHQWSKAIRPMLTSEIHIPEYIYHYIHNSSNHADRYGIHPTTANQGTGG